ncbi:MAG: flagellar biosynthesis protein FlhF [Clostridia bacterium]|nr:flagellar biosynthesis protein FlhF [Clostridia bacterium]
MKRYYATSIPEALNQVRKDLGRDAIIVDQRRVRRGPWWNILGRRYWEITAAADDNSYSSLSPFVQIEQRVQKVESWLQEFSRNTAAARKAAEADRWREVLEKADLNSSLIDRVLSSLPEGYRNSQPPEVIWEQLVEQLAGLFAPGSGMQPSSKVLSFVGPTGVGKTTTLAKLAALMAVYHRKRVALITTDTYRIGAVEQLRTYAEILGVPLEVANSPGQLRQQVSAHQDKDYIFIDTAGRPSRNAMMIQEVAGFTKGVGSSETYLVLSCGTKTEDLFRIVKDFRPTQYRKLIFTKLDETESLGNIANIGASTGLPIAYITTGQRVPDDIEAAQPRRLAELIVGVQQHA